MSDIVYMPCHPEHIRYINPQEHDKLVQSVYLRPGYHHVITENFSMSAWVKNRCVCAAGITECVDGTYLAWSVIGKDAGPYLRQLLRKIRAALDLHHTDVYMTTPKTFKHGCQMALMLGFQFLKPVGDENIYWRPKHG